MPEIKHRIAVIAHRGGAAIRPENTLAAFEHAIELGVDYVEIDVRMTVDRQFVILHDRTVDRTTTGTGAVKDLEFDAVRVLDAGARAGAEYAGALVPTLDQVLECCRDRVHIYLDHKDGPVEQVLEAVRRYGMERRTVVYSGVHGLREWKRLAPEIPVMPSLPDAYRRPGGIAEFEKLLPAEVLDGHVSEWTRELVDEAHALGIKVYVDIMGLLDNAEGYAAAIEMGVDGLQTDYPDRLLAFLSALESSQG
jgi:glycerophosphoryl diester phosphodiesterase